MDDGHPKIIVGMDHSNHDDALPSTDHSSHISPAMDHMMMMYFHGGYNEVILFDIWRISTVGGLIGSMIGCFLLGILYEAIKSYREHWMRGAFQTINISQVRKKHDCFFIPFLTIFSRMDGRNLRLLQSRDALQTMREKLVISR